MPQSIWSHSPLWASTSSVPKAPVRIPEKTLFLAVILGGGIGGTAGMFFFRHKTRHWYFRFFFPLLAVLQAAGLIYLYFI